MLTGHLIVGDWKLKVQTHSYFNRLQRLGTKSNIFWIDQIKCLEKDWILNIINYERKYVIKNKTCFLYKYQVTSANRNRSRKITKKQCNNKCDNLTFWKLLFFTITIVLLSYQFMRLCKSKPVVYNKNCSGKKHGSFLYSFTMGHN